LRRTKKEILKSLIPVLIRNWLKRLEQKLRSSEMLLNKLLLMQDLRMLKKKRLIEKN